MNGQVTVYERDRKIFVVPMSKTIPGFYVEKTPVRIVDNNDWLEVGKAVLQALADYEENVPAPDWRTYKHPTREAAGIRSDREFHRGLKSCSIEVGNKAIRIIPDENKGIKEGLIPLNKAATVAAYIENPDVIGRLVQEGLSRAL